MKAGRPWDSFGMAPTLTPKNSISGTASAERLPDCDCVTGAGRDAMDGREGRDVTVGGRADESRALDTTTGTAEPAGEETNPRDRLAPEPKTDS